MSNQLPLKEKRCSQMRSIGTRYRRTRQIPKSRTPENESPARLAAPRVDRKGSVTLWIEGLRGHADQRAASFLYHRYFGQLVDRLRHRINRGVRSVSDAEDTAEYVLSEVLMKLEKGKYPSLDDRNSLWALMITIGDQRVRYIWRRSTARKRDVRRTVQAGGTSRDNTESTEFDFVSYGVSPELAAEIEDMIEFLSKRLSNKQYRKLLIWELQGYSPQEIKESLEAHLDRHVTDRSLRRWRNSMREELRALYDQCLAAVSPCRQIFGSIETQ